MNIKCDREITSQKEKNVDEVVLSVQRHVLPVSRLKANARTDTDVKTQDVLWTSCHFIIQYLVISVIYYMLKLIGFVIIIFCTLPYLIWTSKSEVKKVNGHILQILLKDEQNNELRLNYRLERNSPARKFYRLVRNILLTSHDEVRYAAWGVYPSGEAVKRDLCQKLRDHMEFFNLNNRAEGMSFKSTYPNPDNITPEHLNMIHSEFEKLITRTYSVPTGEHNRGEISRLNVSSDMYTKLEKSLNAVNGLVHAMEHILIRGSNSSASFFTAYLSSDPFINPIPLSDNDYNLFTLENHFGDLFLGYGTTGKSLYHLFKDNDIALVEKGGKPSPQQYVTPNILGVFYHTTQKESFEEMMGWMKKHEIAKKLKINVKDKKNGHGYIKLGTLILPSAWENMSENEIISIISPYSNVLKFFLPESIEVT